jgi:hypothetical protein
LLKQPGAIAAIPLGIYLLLPSYRLSRGITRTVSVIQAGALTAGFFTLLGLIMIVLQTQGILRDALYWTVSAQQIPHVFWQNGVLATLAFAVACLALIIGAGSALRDSQKMWAAKSAERLALLALLAASAIGTAAGARFYPHYYVQLVPSLALLAAPYLRAVFGQRTLRPIPAVAIGLWLALTVVSFSIAHWCELIARRKPTGIGQYLATHAAADDLIFIWGRSAAQYYLDAHRRPACRYVVTFPLTGFIFCGPLSGVDTRQYIAPGAWTNLQEDFARQPPAYIADLYATPDAQYPVRDFVVLSTVLIKNYRPVAQINNAVIYQRRP